MEETLNSLLRTNIVAWSKDALKHLKDNARLFIDNGISLAIDTDVGRPETYSFQGCITLREMRILAGCCLSAMETIVAATKNGADIIGKVMGLASSSLVRKLIYIDRRLLIRKQRLLSAAHGN